MTNGMLLQIAGIAVSSIGTATNLFKTIRDLAKWEEKDIEVDNEWLPLAIKKGILEGKPEDYVWPQERHVPTHELNGKLSVVIAINEEKRLKYRVVQGHASGAGGRLILMRRIAV